MNRRSGLLEWWPVHRRGLFQQPARVAPQKKLYETGISKSSVAHYFALFGVQPHRTKSFRAVQRPFFIEKVRNIVGLYLSPPTNALVLCVDEKNRCQALEGTQPVCRWDSVTSRASDKVRHGTTTLFAAIKRRYRR